MALEDNPKLKTTLRELIEDVSDRIFVSQRISFFFGAFSAGPNKDSSGKR